MQVMGNQAQNDYEERLTDFLIEESPEAGEEPRPEKDDMTQLGDKKDK